MNVQSKLHRFYPWNALFVGLCGGVISVLIDADHVLWGGREWHLPVFFIGGLILCGCSAYLGRLFVKMVLKSSREKQSRS